ncbi:MAG TPA: C4-dicarboxylate transporter DcuC [Gemmataceae bacterium]|nr:C4-dicarboxylate transporter DcuC [Gemmataceae bacterium]
MLAIPWEEVRPLLGMVVIAAAVYAIYRRLEVRLTLILAALALGALAEDMPAIVQKFLVTFTNEMFVVPICTAMGFAYVLRHTQCDQHLVHLLMKPLQRVRGLLIPGTVVVGFLVNMPIVSQTSTAVTIGTVAIPLLLAARLSPVTIGAALLLGSSIGGELLNPGAPELRTVIVETDKAAKALGQTPPALTSTVCVERILPLNLVGVFVATGVFWLVSARAESRSEPLPAPSENGPPEEHHFVVNPFRALVPLVPLLLLYLLAPPLELFKVPHHWLEDLPPAQAPPGRFESRLIGTAMLIGVAVAALAVPRKAGRAAFVFFEGAGYGFTHIISLIVAASCFGEGIRLVGVADLLGNLIQQMPGLLLPAAGLFSLGFGVLSGSGMATAQSLFPFFAEAALRVGADPAHVGAVVSLGAAAGRTLSPVAAVTLMCAAMTRSEPLHLLRRLAPAVLAGALAMILASILLAPPP